MSTMLTMSKMSTMSTLSLLCNLLKWRSLPWWRVQRGWRERGWGSKAQQYEACLRFYGDQLYRFYNQDTGKYFRLKLQPELQILRLDQLASTWWEVCDPLRHLQGEAGSLETLRRSRCEIPRTVADCSVVLPVSMIDVSMGDIWDNIIPKMFTRLNDIGGYRSYISRSCFFPWGFPTCHVSAERFVSRNLNFQ